MKALAGIDLKAMKELSRRGRSSRCRSTRRQKGRDSNSVPRSSREHACRNAKLADSLAVPSSPRSAQGGLGPKSSSFISVPLKGRDGKPYGKDLQEA